MLQTLGVAAATAGGHRAGAPLPLPPPTLCSSVPFPGPRLCLRPSGPSTMAKPGQDTELNRLVQDQLPGQVAPSLAPPNLVDHLPNVPHYPPITRIPVLISRRTALSNSSFAKETRSGVRRLGSVSSATHMLVPWCVLCMAWAFPAWEPWAWCGSMDPLPLLTKAFIVLCGDLRAISSSLSVPKIPQLATRFFGLNIAFFRSSFFYTSSHSDPGLNKSLRSPGQEAWGRELGRGTAERNGAEEERGDSLQTLF